MLAKAPGEHACSRSRRSHHKNRLVYLILHFSAMSPAGYLGIFFRLLAQHDSSYMNWGQLLRPNSSGLLQPGNEAVRIRSKLFGITARRGSLPSSATRFGCASHRKRSERETSGYGILVKHANGIEGEFLEVFASEFD